MRQHDPSTPAPRPVRLIRRYENRKFYDAEASVYISLGGLAQLIRDGCHLHVVEHASGEDITAQTLWAIVADQERAGQAVLPKEFLHDVVRWGHGLVHKGRGQIEKGWTRTLELVLDRVGPLQQAREEMGRLHARLGALEDAVRALKDDVRRAGRDRASGTTDGEAPREKTDGEAPREKTDGQAPRGTTDGEAPFTTTDGTDR